MTRYPLDWTEKVKLDLKTVSLNSQDCRFVLMSSDVTTFLFLRWLGIVTDLTGRRFEFTLVDTSRSLSLNSFVSVSMKITQGRFIFLFCPNRREDILFRVGSNKVKFDSFTLFNKDKNHPKKSCTGSTSGVPLPSVWTVKNGYQKLRWRNLFTSTVVIINGFGTKVVSNLSDSKVMYFPLQSSWFARVKRENRICFSLTKIRHLSSDERGLQYKSISLEVVPKYVLHFIQGRL